MKKIMIVDDNADLRYSVSAGLKSMTNEFEFVEAESGEQCLEMIKTEIPDLILLDIMMPGTDGWDVAAELKKNENTKHIPIIFLTAKTDLLSKGMGKLTAEDYIEKPFKTNDLLERIKKII